MAIAACIPPTASARVVPSVTTVSEEMKERTGQEQEVRHDAEEVGAVLAEEKEGRDDEEPEQGDPGRQQTIHRSVYLLPRRGTNAGVDAAYRAYAPPNCPRTSRSSRRARRTYIHTRIGNIA